MITSIPVGVSSLTEWQENQRCFEQNEAVINAVLGKYPKEEFPLAFYVAAEQGSLDLVKMFKINNMKYIVQAVVCAALSGQLDVIKYLIETFAPPFSPKYLYNAAFSHHSKKLDVIRYIKQIYSKNINLSVITKVKHLGDSKIVATIIEDELAYLRRSKTSNLGVINDDPVDTANKEYIDSDILQTTLRESAIEHIKSIDEEQQRIQNFYKTAATKL
jgi:hypothetical protein